MQSCVCKKKKKKKEKRFRLNRFPLPTGLEPGTTRSASILSYWVGLREIERARRGKDEDGLMSIP